MVAVTTPSFFSSAKPVVASTPQPAAITANSANLTNVLNGANIRERFTVGLINISIRSSCPNSVPA